MAALIIKFYCSSAKSPLAGPQVWSCSPGLSDKVGRTGPSMDTPRTPRDTPRDQNYELVFQLTTRGKKLGVNSCRGENCSTRKIELTTAPDRTIEDDNMT